MKNIKRWLSFLMAFTLLLSLAAPAYAENDAGAVSTAEAEQTTAPEDPSAQPVADDTTADVVEDGYYLVGTMNNWQPSAAYKFAVNPESQTVGIAQAGCREDAKYLMELLRKEHPPKEILPVEYEPVTGSHVGPGALALFFLSNETVRFEC